MRTDLYLLMLTEGRPFMRLDELAKLVNMTEPSLKNKIRDKRFAILTFRLDGELVAHVSDVAKYIEDERAAALKMLQPLPEAA